MSDPTNPDDLSGSYADSRQQGAIRAKEAEVFQYLGIQPAAPEAPAAAAASSDASKPASSPFEMADWQPNPQDRRYNPATGQMDGEQKGRGFFGPLKTASGAAMTELSIGYKDKEGKPIEVPTLVPTLTPDEVRTVLNVKDGEPLPDEIMKKAREHAQQRLDAGLPVFATPAEEGRFTPGGARKDAAPDFATAKMQADGAVAGQAADNMAAVGKDVARGVVEAPRAIVKGMRDAVQASSDALVELNNWMGSPFGLEAQKPVLPGGGIKDAGTVTGGLIQSTAQFLTGFWGAGKLQTGLEGFNAAAQAFDAAGTWGMSAIKGAAASFTAFDAHANNLANLVQAHPALQNPVTELLASDPDDGAAVGRAKNALVGMMPGALADGFILGLRTMRRGWDARVAARAAASAQPDPKTVDWSVLGDHATSEAVVPEMPRKGQMAGKAADATPDQVLGDAAAAPADSAAVAKAAIVPGQRLGVTSAADEQIQSAYDNGSYTTAKIKDGSDIRLVHLQDAAGGEGRVEAFDASGNRIGGLSYYTAEESPGVRTNPTVEVDEAWQRKGVATALYDAAEAGGGLIPDVAQKGQVRSDAGQAFREARDQGRKGNTVFAPDQITAGGAEPPVPDGHVRVYHSGSAGEGDSGRWVSTDRKYASDYRKDSPLFYTDLPESDPRINNADIPEQGIKQGFTFNFELTPEEAAKLKETPRGVPTGGAPVTATENPRLQINFTTINSPEDAQRVMQNMVDLNAEAVDAARRGVRTWGDTKLSADQKDAWRLIVERRQGEAWNAEQTQSARQLWATSGQKLHDVAVAAAHDPSEANLVVFGKMMQAHHAVQTAVMGARAESGRATNAWAIPVEGGKGAEALQAVLDANGGAPVTARLAKYIAAAYESGDAKLAEQLVQKGMFAKTSDAVAQVWINGLLTNPATHVANAISNTAVAAQSVYESAFAAGFARLTGAENSVVVGEAGQRLFGAMQGIKDAFRVTARGRQVLASAGGSVLKGELKQAVDALSTNAAEFGNVYRAAATGKSGFGSGMVENTPAQGGALSSETWGFKSDTWLGRAFDTIDHVTGLPGRMLASSDEFYKTLGYRMELHAQAFRQATQEVSSGAIAQDAFKARIAELVDNPPPTLQADAIHASHYQTFTQKPARVLDDLGSAWQNIPLLGKLTLPFKNTPINAMTYAFERTPFAPLVQSWREDIAAGGARADTAMARMATGTAIMLATMDAAFSDNITGSAPTEPGLRAEWQRMGRQPYSVKYGDTWYAYNRLDPLGTTMGLGADLVQTMLHTDAQQADLEKAFQAAVLGIGKNTLNKSYMSGAASFIDALSDPERYGASWFARMAGSVVPGGVATIARAEDPYMRAASNMVESIQRRVPGWSKELPPVRDLWGRARTYESGEGAMYDAISPVYVKRENPEPVDKEFMRLGYYPQLPAKKISIQGVNIDLKDEPHLYSEYVRLAGSGAKDPNTGKGAMDYLNAVVSGKADDSAIYQSPEMTDGPDGTRAIYLRSRLEMFRDLAKQKMIDPGDPDYSPRLAALVHVAKTKAGRL